MHLTWPDDDGFDDDQFLTVHSPMKWERSRAEASQRRSSSVRNERYPVCAVIMYHYSLEYNPRIGFSNPNNSACRLSVEHTELLFR